MTYVIQPAIKEKKSNLVDCQRVCRLDKTLTLADFPDQKVKVEELL